MKNLELNNYGVTEMNASEMKSVDGGLLFLLLVWYNENSSELEGWLQATSDFD